MPGSVGSCTPSSGHPADAWLCRVMYSGGRPARCLALWGHARTAQPAFSILSLGEIMGPE